MFIALGLERKVDHHNGVFLHDADQQNDSDQADHAEIVAGHDQGEQCTYPGGWKSPGEAAPDARSVAYDLDHRQGLYVDQWFMPHARFVLFSGSSERPPSQYVISSPSWARAHPRLRARELWRDPEGQHALFRVASSP